MSLPTLTFSDDQAEAHDRLAELLRAAGVDIDEATTTPRAEGKTRIMAVIGKAGSGKTLLLAELTRAVADAGAESVTLVNTLLGMVIDTDTGRPVLGAGGGGASGIGIHPVAVRAVHDVRAAHPDLAIVGVGGVATGRDAAELLLAGANAVQVGTATFADPRAPWTIQDELIDWAQRRGIDRLADVSGAAHRGGL